MTNDLLREGAALVRALFEGDETARNPLIDWILEHGLPAGKRLEMDYVLGRVVIALRTSQPVFRVIFNEGSQVNPQIYYAPRIGSPSNWVRVGLWPERAWKGTY